jgi:hypothetical protein
MDVQDETDWAANSAAAAWVRPHPAAALTLRDILAMRSVASVGMPVLRDPIGEPEVCAGIDPVAMMRAPIGEILKVDLDAFNDRPEFLVMILGILRRFGEISPSRGKVIGVFEERAEGVVIFLPAPRDANDVSHTDSLLGRSRQPQG